MFIDTGNSTEKKLSELTIQIRLNGPPEPYDVNPKTQVTIVKHSTSVSFCVWLGSLEQYQMFPSSRPRHWRHVCSVCSLLPSA